MSVGKNIRKHRKEKKLTQKQLASILGVSEGMISQYESKETLKLDTIKKIAKALDINYFELLDDETIKKNVNKPIENYFYYDWVMFYSGIYQTYCENDDLFHKWYKKTSREINNYIQDVENLSCNFNIPFYKPDTSYYENILKEYKEYLCDIKNDLDDFKDILENMYGELTEKDFFDTVDKKRSIFIKHSNDIDLIFNDFFDQFNDIDFEYKERIEFSNDYYNSLDDEEIERKFNILVNTLKSENEKFKKVLGLNDNESKLELL